jgi:hypothetical protein
MQKVADVSEWKFVLVVSIGVLLSITPNVGYKASSGLNSTNFKN